MYYSSSCIEECLVRSKCSVNTSFLMFIIITVIQGPSLLLSTPSPKMEMIHYLQWLLKSLNAVWGPALDKWDNDPWERNPEICLWTGIPWSLRSTSPLGLYEVWMTCLPCLHTLLPGSAMKVPHHLETKTWDVVTAQGTERTWVRVMLARSLWRTPDSCSNPQSYKDLPHDLLWSITDLQLLHATSHRH